MSRTLTIREWIEAQVQRGVDMGRMIQTCQRIQRQMQGVADAMSRYERRREAACAMASTEPPTTEQQPRDTRADEQESTQ